ncbi:MAG: Hydroxypyruvate isomerase [Parcubacteria group bacterium GW2011_GWA2_43_17]|nr:MAG: Hydroxypyruvate isomerase [Parcubacteria group bacterium GW2011_GWA2_43_17]
MAKLSVCAECFFTNLPFEKRIEKIAGIGYKYIEFWHPEGTFDGKGVDFSKPKDAKSLKKAAKDNGITINDFAFSAWDGSIGGNATNDKDHAKYLEQTKKMLDFANAIGCKKGIILSGMTQKNMSKDKMLANLTKAYAKAVELAEKAKITLVLEPLNSLVDHAGYFFDGTAEAVKIIRKINSPNLKLLYDVYHMQIMQGNIIDFISKNIDIIGHFHSAGVPGRAELFDTEVNYPAIIKKIDELGYKGCFGLEYFPKLDHTISLKKTLKYLI